MGEIVLQCFLFSKRTFMVSFITLMDYDTILECILELQLILFRILMNLFSLKSRKTAISLSSNF